MLSHQACQVCGHWREGQLSHAHSALLRAALTHTCNQDTTTPDTVHARFGIVTLYQSPHWERQVLLIETAMSAVMWRIQHEYHQLLNWHMYAVRVICLMLDVSCIYLESPKLATVSLRVGLLWWIATVTHVAPEHEQSTCPPAPHRGDEIATQSSCM